MPLPAWKINLFLLYKLPSAFICGVRVKNYNDSSCIVSVRHRWINQNPFRSMYFAVQMMAGEMSTGAMFFHHINKSGKNISMLVTANKSTFSKKATGRINFQCNEGHAIEEAIVRLGIEHPSEILIVRSTGTDASGTVVAEIDFEWSIKLRT